LHNFYFFKITISNSTKSPTHLRGDEARLSINSGEVLQAGTFIEDVVLHVFVEGKISQ